MRWLLQFCPIHRASALSEITPEFIRGLGLRGLLLDLDNTLVPWHGREVPAASIEWISQMREAGIGLCIVSNTHRPRRLTELAETLGVAFVPSGGKPRRGGFRRAAKALGLPVQETAVVGDQVMTDIWGGNRCGIVTILVEPLSDVEFWGTRVISRRIERLLLAELERRGVRPLPMSGPLRPQAVAELVAMEPE